MSVGNEVLSSLCAGCPWPIVEPEHEPGGTPGFGLPSALAVLALAAFARRDDVAPTAGLEPANCATAYLLTLIAEASREVLREPACGRERALAGLAELLAERLPRLAGAHLSEGVG